MPKYPVYLELRGKRVVVIGAGSVAVRKIQSLRAAGARVVVVAPDIDPAFGPFCDNPDIEIIISSYSMHYLAGALLAIAATNDPELNKQVYHDCQRLEVLCNVVDQPELCDFFVPALVNRGPLQIAIGTDGFCPAYAGHIRKKIEDIITEDHGRFVLELEKERLLILDKFSDPDVRKSIIEEMVTDESFEYFLKKGSAVWHKRITRIIADRRAN